MTQEDYSIEGLIKTFTKHSSDCDPQIFSFEMAMLSMCKEIKELKDRRKKCKHCDGWIEDMQRFPWGNCKCPTMD